MLAAAVALVTGATIAAGCSSTADSSMLELNPTAPLQDDGDNNGFAQSPTEDAAAPTAAPYRGNPLCHLDFFDACMPDDDGVSRRGSTLTAVCVTTTDAGTATDAAAGGEGKACRIEEKASGIVAPRCFENESGTGGDGASCTGGADCAAGFDCVSGERGSTCRHYCCAGTCKGNSAQSGGSTFCDVQDLVDVNQKAPVCMPLKSCKLLGTGECSIKESCAVVNESGDTGCVAIGQQQVGASCDQAHCASQLTCLGQPGARKCYKLCKVGSSDCGAGQMCGTSTAFKDPSFGICQTP